MYVSRIICDEVLDFANYDKERPGKMHEYMHPVRIPSQDDLYPFIVACF